MKDIRDGLQERLAFVSSEIQELEEKLQRLKSRQQSLQDLLEAEQEEWAKLTDQPDIFSSGQDKSASQKTSANGSTSLAVILRDLLADGNDRHLDDLVAGAKKRGYKFGDKAPGRVVHFALIGMKSGNQVEALGEGFWKRATAQGGRQPA